MFCKILNRRGIKFANISSKNKVLVNKSEFTVDSAGNTEHVYTKLISSGGFCDNKPHDFVWFALRTLS